VAEIGSIAQQLALFVALAGVVFGVFAGVTRSATWARVSERSVFAACAAATLAIGCLFLSFGRGDFGIMYVAETSARAMPMRYRLAALWGGQDGSLLLWLWMLSIYSSVAVFTLRDRARSLLPWACVMLLANQVFFLVLVNFFTNPFELFPPGEAPSDGRGLNPLLQHPLMTIHPLLLYAGFVGFAVPFAFGFAALMSGELGTAWFRATRRWAIFAWAMLGVGILLGGRWAYEVLGWGGYWAWDPVENASFMPWLVATAYLHSVMIQEKRDMLRIWNLVLIGLTYILCLFGTFLTRSGIVQSVHAFAQTDWFGRVFLSYVVISAGLFFVPLFVRRHELRSPNRLESVISREASFLINNWIFLGILLVVLWGTLFPVLSEAVSGTKIAVHHTFFNRMNAPLAMLLLLLTGVGPLIAWRRASPASLKRQFVVPATVGAAMAVVLLATLGTRVGFYPLVTWSLSAFVVATVAQEYGRAIRARVRGGETPWGALATLLRKNQRRYGGYVVHLGIVFVLVGAAGAAFNEERLENVRPGDSVTMNGYTLRYLTAHPLPAQHYGGAQARIALFRGDEPLATLVPEKRVYWLEEQPTSIPAIRSSLREDLYVLLTAVEADGSATLKIHRNPLVAWIWLGGATFVLGTILVMWPHAPRPERGRPEPPSA
jgi:cytochrome c-type biogenesis protein CcmF